MSPRGLHAVFERFRGILHEGSIDTRVQYTIEALFAVRKGGFADYPAIPEELDLVEAEDQVCIFPPPHFKFQISNLGWNTIIATQIVCESSTCFLSACCVGETDADAPAIIPLLWRVTQLLDHI